MSDERRTLPALKSHDEITDVDLENWPEQELPTEEELREIERERADAEEGS